jgi:hypothetical protein
VNSRSEPLSYAFQSLIDPTAVIAHAAGGLIEQLTSHRERPAPSPGRRALALRVGILGSLPELLFHIHREIKIQVSSSSERCQASTTKYAVSACSSVPSLAADNGQGSLNDALIAFGNHGCHRFDPEDGAILESNVVVAHNGGTRAFYVIGQSSEDVVATEPSGNDAMPD